MIFYFCLAKIEIAQKVANWRFLSCQLATFQLKTQIWPPKNTTNFWSKLPIGNSKVANWQLFEQFQFWLDKNKKSLFNIIWKYLIRCYILTFNFNNFVLEIQNYRIKKKKKDDLYFPKFWVGWKRANKHLFFRSKLLLLFLLLFIIIIIIITIIIFLIHGNLLPSCKLPDRKNKTKKNKNKNKKKNLLQHGCCEKSQEFNTTGKNSDHQIYSLWMQLCAPCW